MIKHTYTNRLMNTTERYINGLSEYDRTHFPKTRHRTLIFYVSKEKEKSYIRRVINLTPQGKLKEVKHAGNGWAAYPSTTTIAEPELIFKDEYVYSSDYSNVVMSTVNTRINMITNKSTWAYKNGFMQNSVSERFHDKLLILKVATYYNRNSDDNVLSIEKNMIINGNCQSKSLTTFDYDEKQKVRLKRTNAYVVRNGVQTETSKIVIKYSYNSIYQLASSTSSIKSGYQDNGIRNEFEYLNSNSHKISKIRSNNRNEVNKVIEFEYDDYHELIQKRISEQGKANVRLDFKGST